MAITRDRRSRSVFYLAIIVLSACAYTACGGDDGDDNGNPGNPRDAGRDVRDDAPTSNIPTS